MKQGKILAIYLAGAVIVGFVAFVAGATWLRAKSGQDAPPNASLKMPVDDKNNVVAIVASPTPDPTAPLPKYAALPDFSLTERSGKTITLADLKGQVWVANFIYTTCAGPCGALSGRMAELLKHVAGNPDVRLVSFTVDPDHDSPKIMEEYAKRYNAPADQWIFLTGERNAVQKAVNGGFLLTAEDRKLAEEQPLVHATKFALVDKQGNIRGYYDGISGEPLDGLVRDINRLLHE